jgi:hypothetical protein
MKTAIESGAGSEKPRRRVIDARRLEKATGRPDPAAYYLACRREWMRCSSANRPYRDSYSVTYDISSAYPEAMLRGAP